MIFIWAKKKTTGIFASFIHLTQSNIYIHIIKVLFRRSVNVVTLNDWFKLFFNMTDVTSVNFVVVLFTFSIYSYSILFLALYIIILFNYLRWQIRLLFICQNL